MQIFLFIISYILLAEAGVILDFNKKTHTEFHFVAECAAEEEQLTEKDNGIIDQQNPEKNNYNNNFFKRQDYILSKKFNLSSVSQCIFSPPPES